MLLAIFATSSLTLSACGESPGCRALTGAGIGAAGGALAGRPAVGALVGGAAAGGLTSPNQVYAGGAPCD